MASSSWTPREDPAGLMGSGRFPSRATFRLSNLEAIAPALSDFEESHWSGLPGISSEKEETTLGPKGSVFIELDMISPRGAGEYLIEMEKPGGGENKDELQRFLSRHAG
jgi:hypothetical protein